MADNGRELFLIDGNSLAYRAFFALPETIATSRGVPTNAIFGFASMLVKILTDYGVKPTLVAWDAGMSGREVQYEEYKAERRKRPDLLSEQWPHLSPLVEAMGYQNVKVEGFEADDVIATLVTQAREKGIDVMVVTGDRDMFQLVQPGVRVMATSRGITDTVVYDEQAVLDRYGIPADKITDFYGLKGDTSDNIPGVPGIGDKTAAQLLQEFGTLEEVLANVDKISGAKRKENLVNHADDARVSKQLATAIRDVPVDVDLDSGRWRRSRTARGCASTSASSSCAIRCGASRRRWVTRRWPRRGRRRRSSSSARAVEVPGRRARQPRGRARHARGRADARRGRAAHRTAALRRLRRR